jgi:hypothetical protein
MVILKWQIVLYIRFNFLIVWSTGEIFCWPLHPPVTGTLYNLVTYLNDLGEHFLKEDSMSVMFWLFGLSLCVWVWIGIWTQWIDGVELADSVSRQLVYHILLIVGCHWCYIIYRWHTAFNGEELWIMLNGHNISNLASVPRKCVDLSSQPHLNGRRAHTFYCYTVGFWRSSRGIK